MNRKLEILTPQGLESGDKPQRMVLKKRTGCVRCGNCCKGGGPVLLKEDLQLLLSGALSYGALVTIREGELITSPKDGEIFESSLELVKIRGKEGSAECLFHQSEGGCSIYENRPSQCRAYKCWTAGEAAEGLEKIRLDRGDIFGSLDVLMEVVNRHGDKCSFTAMAGAFEKLAQGGEDAVEEIIDMLQYDAYVRPFLEEKFNVPQAALDLLLGRPLFDAIQAFGFRVEKEGEEYILLPVAGEQKIENTEDMENTNNKKGEK